MIPHAPVLFLLRVMVPIEPAHVAASLVRPGCIFTIFDVFCPSKNTTGGPEPQGAVPPAGLELIVSPQQCSYVAW